MSTVANGESQNSTGNHSSYYISGFDDDYVVARQIREQGQPSPAAVLLATLAARLTTIRSSERTTPTQRSAGKHRAQPKRH